MKTISMIGATIVTFALISYAIAIISEQRKKVITKRILTFLTIGISLDITATTCMIIGSSNTPFTFHGSLGYSALLAMLIDTYFIWKFYLGTESGNQVPRKLHHYSRYAFSWWVIAYITGSLLVALK